MVEGRSRRATAEAGADDGPPWRDEQDIGFPDVGPHVFGDSGSPVILATGEALGLITTINPICGYAASGPWLATNLALAIENGVEVELVTWPLLNDGTLPDLPVCGSLYPPSPSVCL